MVAYKAPLKDIDFILNDVLDYPSHYGNLKGCEEVTTDLTSAITEEAAKFAENVLAPLNAVGDEEGCKWSPEGVTTPKGFKEAYKQYVEAGWPLLSAPEEYGGQGLPDSLNLVLSEMVSSANVSWSGYTGLSHGAIKTLLSHGSEEQKATYLPNLVSGEWTGTMCLTESHCGSDLGQLKTKAVPNDDGSYSLSGTKIFISCGEHDVADNIIHIVLARLPDSPSGTAGISLFVVPKCSVNSDGELGDRNAVNCGSIEKKMGVHGFVTCVMNFDGAKGYLIGKPHRGMEAMFTFMNDARLSTALQGLVHSEIAYQGAVPYAKERLAMRSLSGPKNPDGPADPIIVHPDVRRMLYTIKSFSEASRTFIYFVAQQLDIAHRGESAEEKQKAEQLLALLTPICKGFITEIGCEAAHHGVQVYGGHGYIREWGMEQNQRDSRISTLYEGTTGIQALDLIGRKVLGSQGKLLTNFTDIINEFCESQKDNSSMQEFLEPLQAACATWLKTSHKIGIAASSNPEEVGAASVDFLMMSGYISLAFFWAKIANEAQEKLENGSDDKEFFTSKVHTARFYYQRILPRIETLKATIAAGAGSLMDMPADGF